MGGRNRVDNIPGKFNQGNIFFTLPWQHLFLISRKMSSDHHQDRGNNEGNKTDQHWTQTNNNWWWVNGKALCKKMLKRLGASFVVYGLACAADGGCTYTALWRTLWRRKFAQNPAKLFLQTPRAESCNSSYYLWSDNALQRLNKACSVENISDDAETLNPKIKIDACSTSMS